MWLFAICVFILILIVVIGGASESNEVATISISRSGRSFRLRFDKSELKKYQEPKLPLVLKSRKVIRHRSIQPLQKLIKKFPEITWGIQFVLYGSVLRKIFCGEKNFDICHRDGLIFIVEKSGGGNYGKSFEEACTKKSDSQFCAVYRQKYGAVSVLVSAEIDAEQNGEYIELKTTENLTNEKLLCYWIQCYIGGISKVIIGEVKNGVVHKLRKIKTADIPQLAKFNPEKYISNASNFFRKKLASRKL